MSELTFLDLSVGTGFELAFQDVKAYGRVEIIGIKEHSSESPFVADVSGQKGVLEYTVQGSTRSFSCGANDVIKLCMRLNQINPETKLASPKVGEKAKKAFLQSPRHVQALKTALSNQLAKTSGK